MFHTDKLTILRKGERKCNRSVWNGIKIFIMKKLILILIILKNLTIIYTEPNWIVDEK